MLATVALAVLSVAQPAAPKFELKDGDRVVWVGGTLVEREQRYGYWETALYAAFPKTNFTVRNLGWSGDTVWGESRGRFDYANADKCFRNLVDQVLELKPTVILVSYGANESFEGEGGLPKFEQGLTKLLDALKPANARVVLFTPLPAEAVPGFLTDEAAAARNTALDAYAEVIRTTAAGRGHLCAELFRQVQNVRVAPRPFTDNGTHLTEAGYQGLAPAFTRVLIQAPILDWAKLEPLRKAVVAKNELFFHRWRPQNETYLFGFRKHEQGRNAKEVAEFDPLVAKAEEEIAKLRKELK